MGNIVVNIMLIDKLIFEVSVDVEHAFNAFHFAD